MRWILLVSLLLSCRHPAPDPREQELEQAVARAEHDLLGSEERYLCLQSVTLLVQARNELEAYRAVRDAK